MGLILALGLASGNAAAASNTPRTVHVLFIGNSLTYFNQMPLTFKAMVEASTPGVKLDVMSVAPNGVMLRDHWMSPWTQARLREKHWDYVVLQEQGGLQRWSYKGKNHSAYPSAYNTYADKLAAVVKAQGGKVVIYETTQHSDWPDGYATWVYAGEANKIGGILAPYGRVVTSLPKEVSSALTLKGDSHPSPAGSCVIAATLAAAVFPQPAAKLLEACPADKGGDIARQAATAIDKQLAAIGKPGAYTVPAAPTFDTPPVPAAGDAIDGALLDGSWYARTSGIPMSLGVRIDLTGSPGGKPQARITNYSIPRALTMPIDGIEAKGGILTLKTHDSIRLYTFELARHGNSLDGLGHAWVNGGDSYDDASFTRTAKPDDYFARLDALEATTLATERSKGLDAAQLERYDALYAWLGKPTVERISWGPIMEGPWLALIAAQDLADCGDNDEALAYFHFAVKHFPDDGDALMALGTQLAAMKRYPEASTVLQHHADLYDKKFDTGFESEGDWRLHMARTARPVPKANPL